MTFGRASGQVACLSLIALAGAAWAQQSGSGSDSGQVGIANPAAVFCVERGGSFETRATAEGSRGMCRLPDGTVVDAWTYFRENWDRPRAD